MEPLQMSPTEAIAAFNFVMPDSEKKRRYVKLRLPTKSRTQEIATIASSKVIAGGSRSSLK